MEPSVSDSLILPMQTCTAVLEFRFSFTSWAISPALALVLFFHFYFLWLVVSLNFSVLHLRIYLYLKCVCVLSWMSKNNLRDSVLSTMWQAWPKTTLYLLARVPGPVYSNSATALGIHSFDFSFWYCSLIVTWNVNNFLILCETRIFCGYEN